MGIKNFDNLPNNAKIYIKEIEKFIKEAMPDAIIDIQDLAGDGNLSLIHI